MNGITSNASPHPDRAIKDVRLHSSFLDTEHTLIVGIESRQVF